MVLAISELGMMTLNMEQVDKLIIYILGEEIWSIDNSRYVGEYYRGKKQGLGIYQWSDGSRYEGEWFDNLLHGYVKYIYLIAKGLFYFNDGKTYIGQWRYNTMHGFGKFCGKDGKKYVGYFLNDQKEGFGFYYWPKSKRVYVGFWKAGKQEGLGKVISDKKEKFYYWRSGQKVKSFTDENQAFSAMLEKQIRFKLFFNLTSDYIFENYIN